MFQSEQEARAKLTALLWKQARKDMLGMPNNFKQGETTQEMKCAAELWEGLFKKNELNRTDYSKKEEIIRRINFPASPSTQILRSQLL